MLAKLLVISGPDRGKVFEINAKVQTVFGRSREADVKLNDPRVSPYHCRVEVRHGELFVVDLDSVAGTAVNNTFVLEYALQLGDTFTIGDTTLLVQDPDDLARPAEAAEAKPGAPKPATRPAPEKGAVRPAASRTGRARRAGGQAGARRREPKAEKTAEGEGELPADLPERAEMLTRHVLSNYRIGDMISRGRIGVVFKAHDLKHGRSVAVKAMTPAYGADERHKRQLRQVDEAGDPAAARERRAGPGGRQDRAVLLDGDGAGQRLQPDGHDPQGRRGGVARLAAGLADVDLPVARPELPARAEGGVPQHGAAERHVRRRPVHAAAERLPACPAVFRTVRGAGRDAGQPDAVHGPGADAQETEVDSRSDIFNLGSLLYQLLTGRPPFEGGSIAETITKIRREKPEDPRKFQLAIPQAFAGVVLQMLAKRPEDRYQTMAEVLRDLERTLKYQGMTLQAG